MLSREDNELLTQVRPGTPMGDLFRRFWLPILLPSELPAPDCPPIRARLLGEDLVAFRDSNGKVGFLAENCPHRGASLFFGRNEECGLRCVYHGWKFDVEGNCVDMPNEPPESNFKHKVKAVAYPAREYGGLIWIYMGPNHLEPELPQLEWALVPPDHRLVRKISIDGNYLQAMEGTLDSAHASFLHRWFAGDVMPNRRGLDYKMVFNDGAPKLTVQETAYGLLYGARRDGAEGKYHWRVTQWFLPSHSILPGPNWPKFNGSWIPIDDEHCWNFFIPTFRTVP